MNCSICSKRSVINLGTPFCRDHFFSDLEYRVLRTVKDNNLISPEDKVLVACSGGKDSILLLKVLAHNFPGQVVALLVDEGIENYRDDTIIDFKSFVVEWGIPYVIKSFKSEVSNDLDTVVRKTTNAPCYFCGVFRRSIINEAARELGCTKVATGHNLDDEVQSVLMNMLMGAVSRQVRMGYSTGIISHDKFVQRIKPLRNVTEKESRAYSVLKGWDLSEVDCPYADGALRLFMSHLLNAYESSHKGTKTNILKSFESFKHNIVSDVKELNECTVCGEPTSQLVCKKCKLVKVLE